MKRLNVLSFVVMLAMIVSFAPGSKMPGKEPCVQASIVDAPGSQNPDFGNTPLYFIPNKGQVHQKAKFYAKTSRYTLWMTVEGLVFDSIKAHSAESRAHSKKRDVSRFVFLDANQNPEMVPLDTTLHIVNYIKGNDPSKWHTDLQTSKAVMYRNIYKNIDLKVYGIEKQIEYDWMIKPGGDPERIRFEYHNIKGTRIDEAGNLIIKTRLGEFIHRRPVSYQEMSMGHGARSMEKKEARKEVDVQFKKIGKNTYGFEVGEYDKDHELVIDPVVLAYSTYLGGSGDEHAFGLAVDSSGSAYITGDTASTDFPTDDAYQDTFGSGNIDAFVTKFSASGNSLVYSTYLGGSGSDAGEGIQVDSSGKAYVTGFTGSTDFPIQGAYQNAGGGNKDVFVTVLSSSGSSLVYSTYLGGSGDDEGFAIALDSSKNMYITGRTASTDFPTQNAYDDTFTPSVSNEYDAFVTKIASSGSSLTYSTYLGGSKKETGYGIAVNGSNAYVGGRTTSTNFPTMNEYQSAHGGGDYDAFITKFSSSGSSLIYSTYLGGANTDSAYGIAVDSSGNAYVTGDSRSSDFPTQDAYQDTHAGGDKDAFVTKFSSPGTALEYSTYLGGSETDSAAHITVDSSGNSYVIGATKSSDFPTKRAYQDNFSGDYDAFVSMLSSNGNYLSFSTYLGGGDFESGRGIVVDSSGNIYAAGYTRSSDFPFEDAYQDTLNGVLDAFVTKISTSQFGTLCGAVDNCDLVWTTGGSADWFEQTDTTYYDEDAAQSGAIGHGQSSYLQTTVTGPGLLSFWWKVSCEYWYDYLSFYIDGTYQTSISGNITSWTQLSYIIPEGTHTLKWEYSKDAYCCTVGFDCGWVDKVEFTVQPGIVLSRTQLGFGAAPGSTTGAQTFSISNSTPSTLNWSAAPDQNWLSCTPTSGTNSGVVAVSVDATGLAVGTYNGSITVSDPNAANSPQTVSVTLGVYGPGGFSVPFGEYATPTDNSTISSSVPFTGWVLDDVGVESVKLYRHQGSSLVYIGDAVFVEGARPDVEQAYPDYPYNYRAGWGYMMLTNFLPNGGNGTFTIEAIATDLEGQQVSLGTKTVTVDNASAVKPFGAIDTPAQGGTASGSNYRNQGWVLTPLPNTIPTDGTTINVYIDGVNLGHPTYNVYRPDIASLFPGYNNSNGAHAYFDFDTTAYDNGVHTIMWIATDNAANADGIGSRYFMVQNSSGSRTQSASSQGASWRGAWSREHGVGLLDAVDVSMKPVGIKKGYRKDVETREMFPDDKGIINIQMKELECIELHFGPGKQLSGWMVVGDRFKSLPIGSTLDPDNGIFYWQASHGFCGVYPLMFVERDVYGKMAKRIVFFHIAPKF